MFVDGGRGTIASDRRRGYRQAMRRPGLAARARVIPGDHTEEAGIRAARALQAERLPTAVVTSNDRCAVGLLDAFARQAVAVPGAVSVVGYDDSMLARLAHVDLTTVSQDARQQAERAVELAVERLEGRRTAPREVVLTPAPGRPPHHRPAPGPSSASPVQLARYSRRAGLTTSGRSSRCCAGRSPPGSPSRP